MTTPPATNSNFHYFYLDDSGAQDTGFVVYSWIEACPEAWPAGLRHWLDLRKELYRDYQVGADEELHATAIYGGRKLPSTSAMFNQSKKQRHELLERATEAIGQNPHIKIGTVYRRTSDRGKKYARHRTEVYGKLISHLDGRLIADDHYGQIFMDGDGSDRTYHQAHRSLPLATRRILEDPIYQGSHLSQWVQMADIVAWTTYQSILQYPGKEEPARWYGAHLRGRDINGGPVAV